MTSHVVDTNVPIAANNRERLWSEACQLACVEALEALMRDGVVAIDDSDDIIAEHEKNRRYAGERSVGDAFFLHMVTFSGTPARVRRVALSPNIDEKRGFDELPPNSFDPSDRKFLAVAVAASAVILNATDSDWEEHAELMRELGVEVRQLCPQYATKQARPAQRR